jgi:hypothetical protein
VPTALRRPSRLAELERRYQLAADPRADYEVCDVTDPRQCEVRLPASRYDGAPWRWSDRQARRSRRVSTQL